MRSRNWKRSWTRLLHNLPWTGLAQLPLASSVAPSIYYATLVCCWCVVISATLPYDHIHSLWLQGVSLAIPYQSTMANWECCLVCFLSWGIMYIYDNVHIIGQISKKLEFMYKAVSSVNFPEGLKLRLLVTGQFRAIGRIILLPRK